MPTYRLTYFNIRGRAEVIRMCLVAAGQEFEDRRVSREDWQKIKADSPTGQVPMLEVDGKKLIQSDAIARYVAREYGLYGKDNKENTIIDIILGTMQDLINVMVKVFMEKDETKKEEAKKKAKEEDIPKFCQMFQKILVNNGGGDGWMVGESLSLGDIAVFCVLETIIKSNEYQEAFDAVPKLMAHSKRVADYPAFKNYLANRPETPM